MKWEVYCPESLFEGGIRREAIAWQAIGAVSSTRIRIRRVKKRLPGVGNLKAAAVAKRMTPSDEALVAAWIREMESGMRNNPMEAMRKDRLPRRARTSEIMTVGVR